MHEAVSFCPAACRNARSCAETLSGTGSRPATVGGVSLAADEVEGASSEDPHDARRSKAAYAAPRLAAHCQRPLTSMGPGQGNDRRDGVGVGPRLGASRIDQRSTTTSLPKPSAAGPRSKSSLNLRRFPLDRLLTTSRVVCVRVTDVEDPVRQIQAWTRGVERDAVGHRTAPRCGVDPDTVAVGEVDSR